MKKEVSFSTAQKHMIVLTYSAFKVHIQVFNVTKIVLQCTETKLVLVSDTF